MRPEKRTFHLRHWICSLAPRVHFCTWRIKTPLFPPAVGSCRQQFQADLRQDACIVWRLYSPVSPPTAPGRARREKPFKMAAAAAAARFRSRCFRQAPEKTADSLPPEASCAPDCFECDPGELSLSHLSEMRGPVDGRPPVEGVLDC